jgi:hypothetical protein
MGAMTMNEIALDSERRAHPRHDVHFAMGIETSTKSGRFAVARNASEGGIQFITASRFRCGDDLRLTILFSSRAPLHVAARVLRIESGNLAPPWRFQVAARFLTAQPELARVLAGLAWD